MGLESYEVPLRWVSKISYPCKTTITVGTGTGAGGLAG